MIRINWSDLKKFIDTHQIRARFIETQDGYEIHGADQGLVYVCNLITGQDDCNEFEACYLNTIEMTTVASVSTKFESTDLILKLAKFTAQADENGNAVLSIMVPGIIGKIERYTAGGYVFTDNYHWDDALVKIEIIDKNGVTGAPLGTILKTYHDEDVPEVKQGWFFWKTFGTEGECEVEPIGWYGQINGELELRISLKIQPNVKAKANIWWGKKE